MSKEFPTKNLMINDYLSELHNLSLGIVTYYHYTIGAIEEYSLKNNNVYQLDDKNNEFFFVAPEVMPMFASILVYAADINKLICFGSKMNKLKRRRLEEVRQYFDMSRIKEIERVTSVRNSIEHFDEKIDVVSSNISKGKYKGEYDLVASNFILTSEKALLGKPLYLKCYVKNTYEFHNFKQRANINKLYEEASYILSVLEEKMERHPQAATIIPIP